MLTLNEYLLPTFMIPASIFEERCVERRVFQTPQDFVWSILTPVLAPLGCAAVSLASLIASIYFLSKGEFTKSSKSLLFCIGYAALAPVSPVLALGSLIIRSLMSLLPLGEKCMTTLGDCISFFKASNTHKHYDCKGENIRFVPR